MQLIDWFITYHRQYYMLQNFGVNAGLKKKTEQKWKKALQD